MMSRAVGFLLAAVGVLTLAACSSPAAQPPVSGTNARIATGAAADPATGPVATGCFGVGQLPDLAGLPTAAFGGAVDVRTAATDYQLRVDAPEESQHPDLPSDSAEEILVVMISVTGSRGTIAHLDGSEIQVFDSTGRFCIVPEDQVGYPLLAVDGLPAGAESVGSVGVLALRNTREFVVIHLVDGAPVAVWR